MKDESFNIKALLEIIFRITAISANRFSEEYLHKNPAVVVRWKSGRVLPSAVDLNSITEMASKETIETQKVQLRKEIESLVVNSALPAEFKTVILDTKNFKEFLLEALNTSVLRQPKPISINYKKQFVCEILENIECIDSRLYNLFEYQFYNDEALQIDIQLVEAFKEAMHNLPVRIDLKNRLDIFEKDIGLNFKYIQSFYDEIDNLCAQYNSLADFLTIAAYNSSQRGEIQSCYIEFIKVSMNIIRNYTNITYIKGLIALCDLGKSRKSSTIPLKSISCVKAEEITDKPEIVKDCFSNYLVEYNKLVDEKGNLLEKLKII